MNPLLSLYGLLVSLIQTRFPLLRSARFSPLESRKRHCHTTGALFSKHILPFSYTHMSVSYVSTLESTALLPDSKPSPQYQHPTCGISHLPKPFYL
ncbi:hypothetical protein BKA67DRAFT_554298 [Truncatella angustata]|uniref:Uncharacterized protein n=1 Tax=Truncatella angustata TaxID=152316 RepID=A0A9P8USA6_9PEZI|nr:uncharacterized protein BKA67DRAFT_554298 [Truncatella angustata]KAH6657120.1 hypothetical protein BKA67DRAFT_554298 [Truncatella angustata]